MATSMTTARVRPAPAPIFGFFWRIVSAFERNQEKARIRDELSFMTSRELADLGLVHSDIPDIVAGCYRRT